MSHRGANHRVSRQVALSQPGGHFVEKRRDLGRCRRSVWFSAQPARDDHRAFAQSPRACLGLRVTDQEVQVEHGLS